MSVKRTVIRMDGGTLKITDNGETYTYVRKTDGFDKHAEWIRQQRAADRKAFWRNVREAILWILAGIGAATLIHGLLGNL